MPSAINMESAGGPASLPTDGTFFNSSMVSEIPRRRTDVAPHLSHLQLRSNYNEKLLKQLETRTWVQRPWKNSENRRSRTNSPN